MSAKLSCIGSYQVYTGWHSQTTAVLTGLNKTHRVVYTYLDLLFSMLHSAAYSRSASALPVPFQYIN